MKAWLIAGIAGIFGSMSSLVLVGHAQSSKAPATVAYVSATRIFTESIHGRSEGARIQTLQQQRTADLRVKQQALDATRQELASANDAAAKSALQQKEIQQRTELERATQQATADVQALQREVNQDLLRRVKTALDDLMKTQNYQLVLNSDNTVLWSAPELDLTNALIGRLNGQ